MSARTIRWLLPLLLASLLAACGFHPRGETPRPPASLQPLYLTGLPESHDFMRALRRQLEMAGVELADGPQQAASLVRILRLQRERRVFSVNANNKAVEYEFVYRLKFSVEQPPGHKRRVAEPLVARRIVYEPGGELLGRVREAEMREQDVHADLARRLIRQLASN